MLLAKQTVLLAANRQSMLSVVTGNNRVLVTGNRPAVIKDIVKMTKDLFLICVKFKTVSEAFLYPMASSTMNISVSGLKGEVTIQFSFNNSRISADGRKTDDDDDEGLFPSIIPVSRPTSAGSLARERDSAAHSDWPLSRATFANRVAAATDELYSLGINSEY